MPTEDSTVAAVDAGPEGFGLQAEALAPDAAERMSLPFTQGLVVTDVAAGGPADRAGLRRGDVILEVDRQSVQDAPALQKALAAVPPGRSVLIRVHRPGSDARIQFLVLERETGAVALELLKTREVDLVMLDQRMPGEPGIDVLPKVKAADPSTIVVLATAVHDLRTAVEALKRGAYDYITKPFDVDDILMLVERALEKRALEREVLALRSALSPTAATAPDGFEGLIGRHPEMVKIYQLITQIATTPATVLISGESGTGKELVARAIHRPVSYTH